jgi:mannitol-1-phosphate 5-dehydrogenase
VSLSGQRTYVGLGFGAIQAGLFLYEAYQSKFFGRLVVAEVLQDLVDSVRRNHGRYSLNIAHRDGIESIAVGPVESENPASPDDRRRLLEAIAAAEEIGTAVPSVEHYRSPGPGSIHRLLAEGLRRKAGLGLPRAVVYAAENHNHAAEVLAENVFDEIPLPERPAVRAKVCFVNTVIGKMSGVVTDSEQIEEQKLDRVTPRDSRAFLVEVFNRILISKVDFPETPEAYRRGIEVFQEKDDLFPFEEAKLYGHNATHALAAYLAMLKGIRLIAGLTEVPGAAPFLRAAFLEESGEALIRKHRGLDPLFTPEGYARYVDDLLDRMTNPYLRDSAERVGRDPRRKLEWNDRLIGTIRLALEQGVYPGRYSLGAAAALTCLQPGIGAGSEDRMKELLEEVWTGADPDPREKKDVLNCIRDGLGRLQDFRF